MALPNELSSKRPRLANGIGLALLGLTATYPALRRHWRAGARRLGHSLRPGTRRPPYVTAVDLLLSMVILILLAGIVGRAALSFHRTITGSRPPS